MRLLCKSWGFVRGFVSAVNMSWLPNFGALGQVLARTWPVQYDVCLCVSVRIGRAHVYWLHDRSSPALQNARGRAGSLDGK